MQEINLNLRPSKAFTNLIYMLMLGVVIIILYLPIFWGLKVLLIIMNVIYGLYIIARYGVLKHPSSIVRLILSHDGYYMADSYKVFLINLLGESVVTSLLCFLRYTTPQNRRKHSLLVWKDMLSEEDYRQLLVWLRCH